ncbi:MAG: DNA primase, partial [Prochlorococcaceae cyanobacterium]
MREPLSDELIAAVRERSRITDLFPAGALHRLGREFVTTCPWHRDHHPSLTVNPERNFVFCFVCNRGEDPIGWLQDRQGLSFRDAVTSLARRYSIPLPSDDPAVAARLQAEEQDRQRLLAWRAQLQQRFHNALLADINRHGPGAQYLQQRGLNLDTARDWGLGLNQGRLMLPIRDHHGRCCGFSGRLLQATQDPAVPKYRNSAADVLFQRNQLLFGLDRAAEAIRRSGEVLLVEGPLDVLQLHQAGFTNAVALLGTHLSPQQRQRLQRAGAHRLVLALDGDEAGRRATQTLIRELRPMAIADTLALSVVPLSDGQDPDTVLRQGGAKAFQQLLNNAAHWLGWEVERLLAPLSATGHNTTGQDDRGHDDPQRLQQIDHQARQLLAALPAGGLRRWAEQRLQLDLGAVPKAPVARAPRRPRLTDTVWSGPPNPSRRCFAERRALRLYLCCPDSRELLNPLRFHDPVHIQALEMLRELQRRLSAHQADLAAMGSLPPPDPEAAYRPDLLARMVLTLCPRLDP